VVGSELTECKVAGIGGTPVPLGKDGNNRHEYKATQLGRGMRGWSTLCQETRPRAHEFHTHVIGRRVRQAGEFPGHFPVILTYLSIYNFFLLTVLNKSLGLLFQRHAM